MDEYMKKYFTKEEEFLDEFHMVAYEAASFLGDEWHPNPQCSDGDRQQRQYFLGTGELAHLVFDGASVYHDANGFSSVQIILRSSKRVVNVRVKKSNGGLIAEKLLDKQAA